MAKQTKPINRICQSQTGKKTQVYGQQGCQRPSTIGIFGWASGATDVDLNNPLMVVCGQHKRRFHTGQQLRNVKLRTK